MLHEFQDLIHQLRQEDNHFARLFNEHEKLNEAVSKLMNDPKAITRKDEINALKREKLRLKDEMHRILQSQS